MLSTKHKKKKQKAIIRRIVTIPEEYIEAIHIAQPVFSSFFQFENGLRLAVHKYLQACYGPNWWETSLKQKRELERLYKYVEDLKQKTSYMPWIGDSTITTLLPLHSITLGQLEQIVISYKSELVPQLFPSLDFFTGHMEVIKRIRNLFAHMYPCITAKDIRVAKREIQTLCEHINTKL